MATGPARSVVRKQFSSVSRHSRKSLGLRPAAAPYEVFTKEPSELVIGLVGPLGTANGKIWEMLNEHLNKLKYTATLISISKLIIPGVAGKKRVERANDYESKKALINLGNQIRKESKNNAILAIAAAAEIGRRRPGRKSEVKRQAYIISSLKHPAEVAELRKIYGGGFYLFGVHTDKRKRIHQFSGDGQIMSLSQATELIDRDEDEPKKYGQHTRDTFHLADFFLADEDNDGKLRASVERYLNIIFGCPFITPTFNEFAMFMAFASSVRSADLSRQVGAVVARNNEILSTGANDCPAPDGGLYWPDFIGDRVDDLPRGRDYKRGIDSNAEEKQRIIDRIAMELPPNQRKKVRAILKNSPIKDLTEYGRVVHAEMEALLACARGNVSCRGAIVYCTTFPCHNCAKHIIAAGIKHVIYVEPYPKSKALKFHDDAATTNSAEETAPLVRFTPFMGVGPRVFFDLFSLSLSSGREIERKTTDGKAFAWNPGDSRPRVQMLPITHRTFEKSAAQYLKGLLEGRTLHEQ